MNRPTNNVININFENNNGSVQNQNQNANIIGPHVFTKEEIKAIEDIFFYRKQYGRACELNFWKDENGNDKANIEDVIGHEVMSFRKDINENGDVVVIIGGDSRQEVIIENIETLRLFGSPPPEMDIKIKEVMSWGTGQ